MNATLAEPLFPPRRSSDQRPIDSIERTPEAVAVMPRWRRLVTHPAICWLPGMLLFTFGQVVLLVVFLILGQDPENETQHGWITFISASIGYAFVLILLERRRPRELTRHRRRNREAHTADLREARAPWRRGHAPSRERGAGAAGGRRNLNAPDLGRCASHDQ